MISQLQSGSDARTYPAERRRMLLGAEAEQALLRRWMAFRDPKAAKQLVESHLPLVASIASRYRKFGVPMQELTAEGTLRLYEALRSYEYNGVRFSTYAAYWTKVYIWTCIVKMRVPFDCNVGSASVATMAKQTLHEPAASSDRSSKPLSAPEGAHEWVRRAVGKIWRSLDRREQAVVARRLIDGATLRDVGAELGLSEERVRQIEANLKTLLSKDDGRSAGGQRAGSLAAQEAQTA